MKLGLGEKPVRVRRFVNKEKTDQKPQTKEWRCARAQCESLGWDRELMLVSGQELGFL